MSSRPARLAISAVSLILASALTACGGDSEEAADTPQPPTEAELQDYLASAEADAQEIGDAIAGEIESTKQIPGSAEEFAELSEGNQIGYYEADETTAKVCVEHVADGEPVAFVSWLVNAAGSMSDVRSSKLSEGSNAGCV